jgi:microcystin-dependent protein
LVKLFGAVAHSHPHFTVTPTRLMPALRFFPACRHLWLTFLLPFIHDAEPYSSPSLPPPSSSTGKWTAVTVSAAAWFLCAFCTLVRRRPLSSVALLVLALASLPAASAAAVSAALTPDYTPVGAILPFSADSSRIPAGFLLCNGATYPPTTYPDLFGVIGYSYVPAAVNASRAISGWSNSYTFYVPDLRGVFPVGAGANPTLDVTPRTLGAVVGNENTTLVMRNLPQHTHSGQTGSEVSILLGGAPIAYVGPPPGYNLAGGSDRYFSASGAHIHSINNLMCDSCASAPFRSTPPAMGLHFIIKAGPAATPTPAPCLSMLSVPDASLNGTKVPTTAQNYPAAAGSANPFVTDSAETCAAQCCTVPACVGYTFNAQFLLMGTGGAPCFLWSNVNGYVPTAGYTSGVSASNPGVA